MNILLLITDERRQRALRAALVGLGLSDVRVATDWNAFMQGVMSIRPDVVLLEYDALVAGGQQQVAAAEWALSAMKLPVVIVLGENQESVRYDLELQTGFEWFAVAPFSQDLVRDLLVGATGSDAWVAETHAPDVLDIEFSRSDSYTNPEGPVVRSSVPLLGGGSIGAAGLRQDHPTRELDAVVASSMHDAGGHTAEELFSDLDAAFDATFDSGVGDLPIDVEAPAAAVGPNVAVTRPNPVVHGHAAAVEPAPTVPPQFGARQTATLEPVSHVHMLAPLPHGRIGSVSVAEVVFALAVTGSTGRLRLEKDALRRDVLFLNGVPGQLDRTSSTGDDAKLMSTFGWSSGQYIFQDETFSQVGFVAYGDVLEFLYEGLSRAVTFNEIASRVSERMRRYPAYTSLLARASNVGSLAKVHRVLGAFDGSRPLDSAMGAIGVDPETGLRAAYYGELAGLLAFMEQPCRAPVDVQLSRSTSRATGPVAAVGNEWARTQSSVTAVRSGPPDLGDWARTPTSSVRSENERRLRSTMTSTNTNRPVLTDAEILGTGTPRRTIPVAAVVVPEDSPELLRLRDTMAQLERDPFGFFGVTTASSTEETTARFHDLVRAWHPDRFASSRNPEVREISQRVFLEIRRVYQEVRNGGAPAPVSAVAADVGGGPRSTPSPSAPMGVPSNPSAQLRAAAPSRNVNEALERLRRNTGQHAAITGPAPTGTAAAGSAGARSTTAGLTGDQLVRNAWRALDGGANEKALEMLRMAQHKGTNSLVIEPMIAYIQVVLDEVTVRKARTVIEENLERAESDHIKSQLLTLQGHLYRLDNDFDPAIKAYDKAASLDAGNGEAARWLRHIRLRGEKEKKGDGSFLNKLLNAKISLSGKK